MENRVQPEWQQMTMQYSPCASHVGWYIM